MRNVESQPEISPITTRAVGLLRLGMVAALMTGCAARVQTVTAEPCGSWVTPAACDLVTRSDAAMAAARDVLDGMGETIDPATCPRTLATMEAINAQLIQVWDGMQGILASRGMPYADREAVERRVYDPQEELTIMALRGAIIGARARCGTRGE
ncbi:MAG: hypothetical protein AAB606_03255 [Patescibacteria group bacterium]